ncbi:hypothetical protein TNCV_452731 [Trichonephila clavipes]|nr:hypothetical protein TNCV_452731 [Trichonephila clavipes]
MMLLKLCTEVEMVSQREKAFCVLSFAKGILKKIRDSCPLDEDDLIEFMTVYDNEEVDNEVEDEVRLLTAD